MSDLEKNAEKEEATHPNEPESIKDKQSLDAAVVSNVEEDMSKQVSLEQETSHLHSEPISEPTPLQDASVLSSFAPQEKVVFLQATTLPSSLSKGGDTNSPSHGAAPFTQESYGSAIEKEAPQGKEYKGEVVHTSLSEIWSLTWPQALTMALQFLIGFTDVVVAGRIDPNVQASLGMVVQCQFVFLAVGYALGVGGIAAISQSLGAQRNLRAERFSGLLLFLSILLCGFFMLGGYVFRHQIFSLVQVPTALYPLTERLWNILLWCIPLNYILIEFTIIFRSYKKVFIPMWATLFICVCNVFGDFGFGLGYFSFPKLGAEGLIISTLLSLFVGVSFIAWIAFRSGILSRRIFSPLRWQRKAIKYLLQVSIPSGFAQLLWQFGFLMLFSLVASLPTGQVTALAGMTAGMRIESMVFLPAFSLSTTGSILVGRYLGAGNKEEAMWVGRRVILYGCGVMTAFALVLYPFLTQVAAFVTPDPEAQVQAISYIRFNLLGTPFIITNMIVSGILAGAGASLYSMVINSAGIWLVRLPCAWLVGHYFSFGAQGVFLAMFVSQFFQGTSMYFAFSKLNWTRFAIGAKRKRKV